MSAKKNSLGRGLSALIEDATDVSKPEETVASINEIDINLIEVNPFQPRKTFDEEAIQELATSISTLGIIQPITVRLLDSGKFQLITGERRYRASLKAGLTKMPAYVRTANDQAMLELALVENIQREDLDAIEVAISYQRLVDECSLTQETLSERVGKKRSTVANYLRLLKLPAEIQAGIRNRQITMGHARALINIESSEEQVKILHMIIEDDLSVRQVEDLVRALGDPKEEPIKIGKPSNESGDTSAEVKDFQDQLRSYFNTKVDLKRSNNGAGKIVIPFKSDEELLQIMSLVEKIKN